MAGCDVCGQPATVIRPATSGRERAEYCDYDAARLLGWPDKTHRIEDLDAQDLAELRSRPDYGGRFDERSSK